jgi:hypothetical protein
MSSARWHLPDVCRLAPMMARAVEASHMDEEWLRRAGEKSRYVKELTQELHDRR